MQDVIKTKRNLSYLVLLIAILSLFYALLSAPVAWTADLKRLFLGGSDFLRASRIVMVYHTLAVPFVAFIAIFLLSTLKINQERRKSIDHTLLWGSYLAAISGLVFAYFKGGPVFHGLFLTGLSIVFYGGVNLLFAILNASQDSFSSPLEKTALLLLVFAVLFSACIGGFIGSHYGSSFNSVLAEDIITKKHTLLERALISHLHIMLALVAASILALVVRYYGLKAKKHFIFYLLFVMGVSITSLSTWAVIISFLEKKAHRIINVGAMFLIVASLVWVFDAVNEERKARKLDWFKLLTAFHLIFVNLSVTLPGVYVALNLEKFRQPEMRLIERSFAVGHWHLLGVTCALLATVIFFDFLGLKRKAWFESLIVISHLLISASFVLANFYMFTRKASFLSMLELFLGPGFILLLFLAFYSLRGALSGR
jgi:hypothetical protein